jgi:hypothetical protein
MSSHRFLAHETDPKLRPVAYILSRKKPTEASGSRQSRKPDSPMTGLPACELINDSIGKDLSGAFI